MPPVLDIEGLPVIAAAPANITGNIDIREEVHLDFHDTITAASLTAPPLHIEGESARGIPPDLRLRELGEQISDEGEDACVRGRIRPRGSTDGGLIHLDHLINGLKTIQRVIREREILRPIEVPRESPVKGLVDQR
jgi:hypothetical protein